VTSWLVADPHVDAAPRRLDPVKLRTPRRPCCRNRRCRPVSRRRGPSRWPPSSDRDLVDGGSVFRQQLLAWSIQPIPGWSRPRMRKGAPDLGQCGYL